MTQTISKAALETGSGAGRRRPAGPRPLRWIAAFLLLCALLAWGVGWWVEQQYEFELVNVSESTSHVESHEELYTFFESFPHAAADGLFNLPGDSAGELPRKLKLAETLLDDDYLLEVHSHHRRLKRDSDKPRVFSFHDWIGDRDQSGWRKRLLELLNHPHREMRQRAARCLSDIARKIPEILAAEPLPGFDWRYTRALLIGLTGEESFGPDLLESVFVAQAFETPGALRLWADTPGVPSSNIGVLLRYLDRRDGHLLLTLPIESLLALEGHIHGHRFSTWTRVLSRNPDPGVPAALLGMVEQMGGTEAATDPFHERRFRYLSALGALEAIGDARTAEALSNLPANIEASTFAAQVITSLVRRGSDEFLGEDEKEEALLQDLAYLARTRRVESAGPWATRVFTILHSGSRSLQIAALEVLRNAPWLRPANGSLNGVIALVDSKDFSVAHKAAETLRTLTARWPGIRESETDWEDPLPPELPRDTKRFGAWKSVWEALPSTPEACYLTILGDTDDTGRSARLSRHAAVLGLWQLYAATRLDQDAYRQSSQVLFDAYNACDRNSRAYLLDLIGRLQQQDRREFLWTRYDRAVHEAPVEAREVLRTLDRHLRRLSRPTLSSFLGEIGRRPDASATLIHEYLLRREGVEALDSALMARFETATGLERANLVRYFPAEVSRDKLRRLIRLLGDNDRSVRFWALQRLRNLNNGETFGFEPARPESDPESIRIQERWEEWLEKSALGLP